MNLRVLEYQNERVLLTSQLAYSYETSPKVISNNFNRNKDRYMHPKHFFILSGDVKVDFFNRHQIEDSNKNASVIYLWTEKGALLHAKSLNTDKAWEAYEMLVDEYYTIKDKVVPLSKDKALVTVLRTTADLVEDTQTIKKEQYEIRKLVSSIDNKIEEQITLDYGEQRRVQKGVAIRVYEFTKDRQEASRLFREIYREIKDRFGVGSYKDVKRKDLQNALNYIEHWIPRKVS